ncbi:PREDICTED: uncharacterized protein LOC109208658 [Nicotiana attenuata]|uniref:uncharacterized protein LOC109208658 n=1 Tax=Nicotiana attenuata TaxID=49451 RepID=UPI0009059038|nr:PREDICTED: uncharacterized protein LOC109208658 [Nicotiana attenuata]
MVTVRSLIALAASRGWNISQMDIYNSFLQGDLYEEVYMELPQGFRKQGETKVCRLLKSLYGLKQASRQWNIKLSEALIAAGYIQSLHDYSLFTKRKNEDFVAVLIYVDDLLITGNSTQFINETKEVLHQQFKVKDLGDLKYFLGIEVLRSKSGILLNQRKYCLQLIFDLGLGGAKLVLTPIDLNQNFTSAEFDRHTGVGNDEVLSDANEYQRLVGRVIYLTITRPDIVFIVQTLSQFMQEPKSSHWDATVRVVIYLKHEPRMGIFLGNSNEDNLTCFCDADWASCPNTRTSVTGYLIKFGDSLISWKSEKWHTVSRSSAEAEYRSLAAVTAEVVWLLGLFAELGVTIKQPVKVYCDTANTKIADSELNDDSDEEVPYDIDPEIEIVSQNVEQKTPSVTSDEIQVLGTKEM